MKFLYKGILIASLAMCMTAVTAGATENENVESKQENISFDYQTNMFDIDAGTPQAEQELTVMLVKGDYSETGISLSQIDAADVYYVGQKTGTNYDIFNDLGVKYDSGEFTPGVYTLITSGESVAVTKTKLVIGNAVDKNVAAGDYLPSGWNASDYKFGKIDRTIRYYPENEDGKYIYVCFAVFPSFNGLENTGLVFQNISNDDQTSTKKLFKTFKQLNVSETLQNINSIESEVEIGVQINDIPVGTSDAVDNIVAIPYVKVQTSEESE